ncbi:MAG: thioredoxin-disulfide reductase [Dehalococcoidales bacterium]|nr:thioredoxin-disulfide reductase [Dehalococcoidales bacterium]
MSETNQYDVIVIGGGPAGLTAGMYTSRARLSTLLIEKGLTGGQINNTSSIENFPGFPDGIDGYELGKLMYTQAEKFGTEFVTAEVTGIELTGAEKAVVTSEGNYTAKAVIIAGGSERNTLGVPGEAEYSGRGVSYCATCDAPLFADKPIAIIGGSDTAITEALHLAEFASKVVVIHRRDQLRATKILQERAFSQPKIEIMWDTTVDEIQGEMLVSGMKLNNVKTGNKSILEVSGVFVSIGVKPDTIYLKGIIELDPSGHVVVNEKMETSVPGIFAAGDIRMNSVKQAITAAGDGATAAVYAQQYLNEI